ncbi:hypothetical protein [Streptomyces sp. NPDC050263]
MTAGLVDLLALAGLREEDPDTADAAHEALVRAVAEGARRPWRPY